MYLKHLSYLKFLLKSTNAHGVHSPFVFSYLTQGLYASKKMATDTATDVLLKSISYFKVNTLHLAQQPSLTQCVKHQYPQLVWEAPCFDMLYTNELSTKQLYTLIAHKKLHNTSVILIADIHQNSQKQSNWNALIAAPKITVSLDLFHLGVVCIRKEQAKQHFTLRI